MQIGVCWWRLKLSYGDRPQGDEARDAWLQEQGIVVVRIPAEEVLRDMDAELGHSSAIAALASLFTDGVGSSPSVGEDRAGSPIYAANRLDRSASSANP